MSAPHAPEARARETIDAALAEAGWAVQDRDAMNLAATRGVAVREFHLTTGIADYLLFVDRRPVGVLEAKPEGHTLSGVEGQAERYTRGLPPSLRSPVTPLPFLYLSTGAAWSFANLLDPDPRTRRIFCIHRPETLASWLQADTLDAWVRRTGAYTAADADRPSTLRARLRAMPPLDPGGLYPNQAEAIHGLERSLHDNRPRALVHMATGSGKTLMAVAAVYRLIKFGGARRILFLVDRANLGEQAETEFQSFRTPDDNRKLTELYTVQRLTSGTIGASTQVVISTIQRLYSTLRGAPLEEQDEETSAFSSAAPPKDPVQVAYNAAIPPETFDVVFIDECHRSIYSTWREVLDYFDAFQVGLTATPGKHTYGYFDQNVVMQYDHARAVADGVNVDFEVYRIRTVITDQGSTIKAGWQVGHRESRTRRERWETADEDRRYDSGDLDRAVVARDQIRTIVRALRDRVIPEAFPGRREVPKTLVFAKDDSHAEDIVDAIRTEFARGNAFCTKITYKTTDGAPRQLITDFRTRFETRVAVTVDLVATGTDIKPVEIVVFMRSVQSSLLFEQMKGRGVRVIDPTELQAVSGPDATRKTHFLIVDCVGVTERSKSDTRPLERKRSKSLAQLLDHVAAGGLDPDVLSSLASRLARLDKRVTPAQRQRIADVARGATPSGLAAAIVAAAEPDAQIARAREMGALGRHDESTGEPTAEQVARAAEALYGEAVEPLVTNPELRQVLIAISEETEQLIDEVSEDALIEDGTGYSAEAREKAAGMVQGFESFLEEHKDEIRALQFFYSVPHRDRLRFEDIEALARTIEAPPRAWTPAGLWRAYELLEADRVRGASGGRLLTDIVSLVRFALHQDPELVPHADRVRERFDGWLAQQENRGRRFTDEQLRWLELIRNHVAESLEIRVDDFALTPFVEEGGLGRAAAVFGGELGALIGELNEVLAA